MRFSRPRYRPFKKAWVRTVINRLGLLAFVVRQDDNGGELWVYMVIALFIAGVAMILMGNAG